MLELEHYKADNDRLIKLLNETSEHKDFSEFAQDNKGSVRYLAGPKKYGKQDPQEEEESWVPHEAFEIAHNYREKYGEALTETLINKMLMELNKVWRDRERRQIARVKNQCHTEVRDLRRQITQRAPVSESKQTKMIQRLKDQLAEAKKDLRNNMSKKRDDKSRPQTADHIEDALKVAGTFQEERRKLVQANEILQRRVDDLD